MKPLRFTFPLLLLIVVTTCATQTESSRTILKSDPPGLQNLPEEDLSFSFEEGGRNQSRMLASRTTEPIEVISRLNMGDHFVTLSRNGTIAFVSQRTVGILQILDVSDPASPINISSLKTKPGEYRHSMISSDEKLLYTFAYGIIEVINITDLYAPTLLGDFEFSVRERIIDGMYPRFAVSSDGNTAILSLLSIEIFDISNPKSIQRVYTLIDKTRRTIALRTDDRTLLVGTDKKTLEVFDISKRSSPVLRYNISLPSPHNVMDMGPLLLSRGDITAYLAICVIIENKDSESAEKIIFTINIRPLDRGFAPEISDRSSFPTMTLSSEIALSPDGSYMYLTRDKTLYIRDVWYGESSSTTPYLIGKVNTAAISPDNRIAYLSTSFELIAARVFVGLRIPLGQAYNLASTERARYDMKSGYKPAISQILLSYNQRKIYQIVRDRVESYEIGSSSSIQNPKTYKNNQFFFSGKLELSKDESFLVVTYPSYMAIVETNGLQKRSSPSISEKDRIVSSRICPDQKTLYTVEFTTGKLEFFLGIYDISSIANLQKLKRIRIDQRIHYNGEEEMKISPDCKTLFFLFGNLSIFDISNPESPVHSIALLENKKFDMAFSHRGSIAFLTNYRSEPTLFMIIDYSDHKDIKILSQVPILISDWIQPMIVSEDDKTVIIRGDYGILGFDVSDLSNPKTSLTMAINDVEGVQLSRDKKTLFLGLQNGIVGAYDAVPETNLYFPVQHFSLGEIYSNNLEVFKSNARGTYDAFDKPYKFSKMSLFKPLIVARPKIIPTSPGLPNWMNFDKENGVFTLEPKLVSHLGTFEVSTVVSTEVSVAGFQTLPKVDEFGNVHATAKMNETDAKHLMVALLNAGYLDNERFLTSSYNPNATLQLTPKYENIETKIRGKLAMRYQELFTRITVSPSLILSKDENLSIQTLFPNSLSVVITLIHNDTKKKPNAQFVSRMHSGVLVTNTNQKTRLTLDGSLFDINNALKEISINVTESGSSCGGKIVISDGYNPIITQEIFNISKHVRINQAPLENRNNTIKSQISRYNFVKGEYFMIELSASSFTDANQETLEYHLKLPNSDKKIPSWISQYGLQITGTVPEEVFTSSFDLVLVAKNEFRSTEVPFKMEFRISPGYLLKLLIKYGGYLFSVITIYIIINKILNIIGAKYYRHPKRFVIPVGHPITAQNIYPIFFAAEELKMSEYVQEKLFQKVANELGKGKLTDSELIKYFEKEKNQTIDEAKIWKGVEEILSMLDLHDHKDLKYTAQRFNSCKNMIEKIIFYNLVNKKLNLPQEKETRALYNSIVEDWVELIDYTSMFVVDDAKLLKKIPSRALEEKQSTMSLLHEEKENRNLDLLKHAIAGHAFKYHLMDLRINDININIMEKVHRNSPWLKIKKLLKKDEETIPSNERGKAVYGIEYSIKGNTLLFSGVPEDIFAGRALVVQIVTNKGRILRELSVLGCAVGSLFGKVDIVL